MPHHKKKTHAIVPDQDHSSEPIFALAGRWGALLRAVKWSTTPLGRPQTWPQSLRSALSICLNTRFPACIYWGTEYALLYNEDSSPLVGDKHPWALGRAAREVWPERWPDMEPILAKVFLDGQACRPENGALLIPGRGLTEDRYANSALGPDSRRGWVGRRTLLFDQRNQR